MTLHIPIPPEIEKRLRERAATLGRDMVALAAMLIERGITAPTFDEILDPVRNDFLQSGLTPDQIDDFGRDLITKVRSERRSAHS